jgi:hypothetical protein
MQLKQFNFSKEKFSKRERDQIDTDIQNHEEYDSKDFEGDEEPASQELMREPYSIDSFTNGLTGGSNGLSSPGTFNMREAQTNNNSGYLVAKNGDSNRNLSLRPEGEIDQRDLTFAKEREINDSNL